MNNIIYFELDIFAALVLFIILDRSIWKYMSLQQKMYKADVISTIIVLVIDGISWLTNGIDLGRFGMLNVASNYLYWISTLFPCYFGVLYCTSATYPKLYRIMKYVGLIPIMVGCAFLAVNPFNEWILKFDNYQYSRGPYFLIVGLLPFIHMGLAMIIVFIKQFTVPRYKRKEYLIQVIYMLIPFVGSILQIMVYGLVTIWVGLALSMIICYVYVQHGNVMTDPLTGLSNRKKYDEYCRFTWESLNDVSDNMYLIVIDLNKFKGINDTYGHEEGDRALVYTSEVLKQCADEMGVFAARIGGDEFAIIMKNTIDEKVENLIKQVRHMIAQKCEDNNLEYEITFAIGYDKTNGYDKMSLSKLFSCADKKMYADKKNVCI